MALKNYYKKISGRFDPALFSWAVVIISFLIASIYIIQKGPFLGNDSYAYMKMYLYRPAGYPLFLFILRQLGDNYLMMAVVVQTIFCAASIVLFIRFISKKFDIYGMYILLLLPLALYYFVDVVEPENILTESIAFPIFLIQAIYLIRSILNRNLRDLLIALLINIVLVTIRGQFLFVYPLIVLIGAYIIFRNRRYLNIRYIGIFSLSILLAFFSGSLINKTYHYIFHDTFVKAELNMSFIRIAMYISDEDDSKLFEDEKIQEIHSAVYDSIYTAGYNMNAFYNIYGLIPAEERQRSDLIEHYHNNLSNIVPLLNSELITSQFNPSDEIEDALIRDRVLKQISLTIIKDKWPTYFYIALSEIFVYGFETSRTYLILFLLFYGMSFLGLIYKNRIGEILFFFLTGHIGNLLLIALSQRVLFRYTFYLEFIILSLLIVIFFWVLIKETDTNELQKQVSKDIN